MPARRDFLAAMPFAGLEAAEENETIFVPERHSEKDRAFLIDFMERIGFAMVVTAKNGIRVTNVPVLIERSESPWGRIWWHIARGNPQQTALDSQTEAVAVFHGPHSYISPNWYEGKRAVPTWNFAVVHASGVPRRVEGDEALFKALRKLVAKNERAYGGGDWDLDKLPENYLKPMRDGVIPYEMEIARVEAKFKLGQERSEGDRAGILKALRSGKGRQQSLAELTEEYYRKLGKL